MKTLYSLFAAIIIVTLIASCDSSTSADGSFDAYYNGSWKVISQTEARWDGSQSKAKIAGNALADADTTLYTTPEGVSVEMFYQEGVEGKVGLRYRDSTITQATLDTTDIGSYVIASTPFGEGAASGGYQPHLRSIVALPFDCDSTYNEQNGQIYLHIMKDKFDYNGQYVKTGLDTTDIHHTAQISAQGAYQTAVDLVCTQ